MRKTGLVGGYWALTLVFVVVVFVKTGRFLWSTAVLLVPAFLFAYFIMMIKPKLTKLNDWLDKKAEEPEKKVSELEGTFRVMLNRVQTAEQVVKTAEAEEGRIFGYTKKAFESAKKIFSKEKRKETRGEEAQAVKQERPAIEKSLDMLVGEYRGTQKAVGKAVESIEEEVAPIIKIIEDAKKRKRALEKLKTNLVNDLAKYKDLVARTKIDDATIRKMENLEANIDDAIKKGVDTRILDNANKIVSYNAYLEGVVRRVDNTIKNIKENLRDNYLDKEYADQMHRLDNLRQQIVDDLGPAALEHRNVSMEILRAMNDFDSLIRSARQSEISELKLEHLTKAAEAQIEATEASRKIYNLEQLLQGSKTENLNLSVEVENLNAQLGDVKKQLAIWQGDLEVARAMAKGNPHLDPKVIEVLGRNINEQTSTLTTLVSTLAKESQHADSCESRLDINKQELAESKKRLSEVQTEINELSKAKDLSDT
ncbi:MAG: hypothetical protein V1729_06975, partial [Candidatus Woesearchaeota archaeon]